MSNATPGPMPVADDALQTPSAPQLSTDFLNRYTEILMLIEIVPMDFGIVDDLLLWQPVGYREHFLASQLRCAPGAIVAYDILAPCQREAFERVCAAMNALVATTTALVVEIGDDDRVGTIVEVASEAMRSLMSRATQFINANGRVDMRAFEARVLQLDVDAVLMA